MPPIPQVTVEEVAQRQKQGTLPIVLDVRNPDELAIASLPFTTNIPMPQITQRIAELEAHKQDEIIVMCHHGGRSQRMAEFLSAQGFTGVKNLVGGIHHWSLKIDPTVPEYQ
ncbi:MAG: rhodanese-like domain-containing protein [Candidatus Sumerlaeia bacterium]|nr:rhodanese-like domain-containing protein [Candidatus Sumerlaeia bacterium]